MLNCVYWKRIVVKSTILICLVAIGAGAAFAEKPVPRTFTVVIDAGHGGRDPGSVGKTSYEKNIALAVAKRVGFYIESLMPEVRVLYTRTTDVFIDLDVRAKIANDNKADLFLSIHVNGFNSPTVSGASTYVMGLSKSKGNFDLVSRENKVILLEENYQTKYEGFDPTSPESYIMFSILQNNNLDLSLAFAGKVQDQFRTRAKRIDKGVHQDVFLVLWKTTMPSALIELGFITNPTEEIFLNSQDGQDILASAIFRGFREYKEEIERREAVTSDMAATQKPALKVQSVESIKEAGNPVQESTRPPILSTENSTTAIEFRVQVMSSTRRIPFNSSEFKGFTGFSEIELDGLYKYMTEPYTEYNYALRRRAELDKTFKGAFIVAFRNGIKISLSEAIKK